jgi:cell division protein FtsA
MLGLGGQRRGSLLGALDIGTHKIVCLAIEVQLGRRGAAPTLTCLGTGHLASAGMAAGTVVNPDALDEAIRAVVLQAERQARVDLGEVYVTVSCGRLKSLSFAAHADTSSGTVTGADVDRIVDDATAYCTRDGRVLVHMNRKSYRIDGAITGGNPRGMRAKRLTADLHAVTADEGAIDNLMLAISRAHLTTKGLVASPYASALGVTSEEERDLGVVVVDLGCGTTGLAVLADGQFRHCEVLATGGHHLTFEIAKNFQAPQIEAERIKTLYASMVNAQSDHGHRFSFTPAGGADDRRGEASKAELADVVVPRMTSLFRAIAARIAAVGAERLPVVLTGGGSQLLGVAEFATELLERDVRIGRTRVLAGMPPGSERAAFASAVGLAEAAVSAQTIGGRSLGRTGYFGEVRRWFANGF